MEKEKLAKNYWGTEGKQLPSPHQLGDYVHVIVSLGATDYDEHSILWHGKVIKAHFDKSKITYDIEFTVSIDTVNKTRLVTRIHNVDGALLCSIQDYKDSHPEKDKQDSPFIGAGWYDSVEYPKKESKYASVEVLCDVNGNRKNFRVGWYDFEEKEWRFHDTDQSYLEVEHLKWTYLPLA